MVRFTVLISQSASNLSWFDHRLFVCQLLVKTRCWQLWLTACLNSGRLLITLVLLLTWTNPRHVRRKLPRIEISEIFNATWPSLGLMDLFLWNSETGWFLIRTAKLSCSILPGLLFSAALRMAAWTTRENHSLRSCMRFMVPRLWLYVTSVWGLLERSSDCSDFSWSLSHQSNLGTPGLWFVIPYAAQLHKFHFSTFPKPYFGSKPSRTPCNVLSIYSKIRFGQPN